MPNPNQAENRDPAEGSRDAVQGSDGGGITNRPKSEEQANQDRVPPRGEITDSESLEAQEQRRRDER